MATQEQQKFISPSGEIKGIFCQKSECLSDTMHMHCIISSCNHVSIVGCACQKCIIPHPHEEDNEIVSRKKLNVTLNQGSTIGSKE